MNGNFGLAVVSRVFFSLSCFFSQRWISSRQVLQVRETHNLIILIRSTQSSWNMKNELTDFWWYMKTYKNWSIKMRIREYLNQPLPRKGQKTFVLPRHYSILIISFWLVLTFYFNLFSYDFQAFELRIQKTYEHVQFGQSSINNNKK